MNDERKNSYFIKQRKFRQKKKDILEGYEPKSRFGSALTGLSDINRDSYNGKMPALFAKVL